MSAISRKAKEVFVAALKLAPDQWDGHLAEACAGDDELRRRVRDLLHANAEAGSFLESPPPGPLDTVAEPIREGPGTIIGPYKLLEQIGEGGFGIVFMAEQTQPVRRRVALKVLKPGMDTRQVVARFEAERQALAIMDHPNIAKVHDGGATATGRPYFVMELVKGIPITEFCDQNQLSPRQRLELFIPVCQAVQHAHHKGIIHRDLKPSNVLVSRHDTTSVVKVIDFGVAKALGQELTDKTLFTGIAQMIGTPLYMSPEQAGMSDLDIDTRSDIYSLGVLLYELLTGSTPFGKERFKEAGYDEIRRIIREEEPPRPSTRLSDSKDTLASISVQRQMEPAKLTRLVRGELDWIVMKALEKDRGRRYETASSFAADVERYLRDEPVAACPPSARYRLRKFTRRHKVGLRIAAAATLVLLLAVAGVSWALWDQASRMAQTEQTAGAALIAAKEWSKQADEALSAPSQEPDVALALWRQAEASLAQAEAVLRTGTAGERLRQQVLDVRERVERGRTQAQQQVNLLRDLDDARMARSLWIETHFDDAGAVTKYAKAFAAYGLEVTPGRTEELARRIRADQPAIREALIVALEHWWDTAKRGQLEELANLVLSIAAASDDDVWRRQYRAAAVATDVAALRALSAQARRLSLPASSLELLASRLRSHGDRHEALALLRWARGRHLTDFWIHFYLGSFLEQGKDKPPVILEEAIGCLRAALALRPAAGAAHNNLGNCLRSRKQLDEAMAEYRKAIELDLKNAAAHFNLGSALEDTNQLDQAIAEYRLAIKLNPDDAQAHTNLGSLLRKMSRLDEALAQFRKAVDVNPKYAPAHNGAGVILHDKNQLDAAVTEYRKAIDLDPKYAEPHNNLGNILRAKNQLKQAIVEFRTAIDLDPNYAAAHFNLGLVLDDQKQVDAAIAEYRKAIDLDPKLASAHYHLGQALEAKKQPNEAVAEYRLAIDLDPKCVEAHVNLGAILHRRNQLAEAIALYRKASDIDPKFTIAWDNQGLAHSQLRQWDQALAAYTKATKLVPKSASAWQHRGSAHLELGQADEAIAAYSKAIELAANNATVHNDLAWRLATHPNPKVRDPRRAVNWAKKAIQLAPKDGNCWNTLGVALYRAGEWQAAIAALEKSMALGKGGSSGDWFFLAMSHEKLGDKGKARQWYDRATRWMDKNQATNEELRRFRAEAAQVLGMEVGAPYAASELALNSNDR